MKIKLTELRKIVRKCILEVTDPDQAANRISQLLNDALDNPALASSPLYGFLRTIGADNLFIRKLKIAIDSGNAQQAQNIVSKISEDKLGVNPYASSSSVSGTRRKVDADADNSQKFKVG